MLSVVAADTDLGEFPQNADPAEKVKAMDGSLGNTMEGPKQGTETEAPGRAGKKPGVYCL